MAVWLLFGYSASWLLVGRCAFLNLGKRNCWFGKKCLQLGIKVCWNPETLSYIPTLALLNLGRDVTLQDELCAQ